MQNSKVLLYDVNGHNDNDNDNTVDNELKLKNRLTHKDFQITTYTVRSIYTDFLEEKQIILRPSYQRNLTWSYDKMNYFLDSLFFFPIVPSFNIEQYNMSCSFIYTVFQLMLLNNNVDDDMKKEFNEVINRQK